MYFTLHKSMLKDKKYWVHVVHDYMYMYMYIHSYVDYLKNKRKKVTRANQGKVNGYMDTGIHFWDKYSRICKDGSLIHYTKHQDFVTANQQTIIMLPQFQLKNLHCMKWTGSVSFSFETDMSWMNIYKQEINHEWEMNFNS
jgi:hypothetical protein